MNAQDNGVFQNFFLKCLRNYVIQNLSVEFSYALRWCFIKHERLINVPGRLSSSMYYAWAVGDRNTPFSEESMLVSSVGVVSSLQFKLLCLPSRPTLFYWQKRWRQVSSVSHFPKQAGGSTWYHNVSVSPCLSPLTPCDSIPCISKQLGLLYWYFKVSLYHIMFSIIRLINPAQSVEQD